MTPLETHVPITPYIGPTIRSPGVLRLDGNEGRTPPVDLLRSLAVSDPEALRAYPNTLPLAELIAERWHTTPDRIVITAGADDAIDRCLRAYAGGRELVLPVPTFEMMHRFAAVAGATTVSVRWGSTFPTDAVVGTIGSETGVVAIVTPNNPTGLAANRDDVSQIARAAPDVLVLIDHIYADYADLDLTDLASEFENVVVVRSFSKAWGFAGCRVGFAVASPSVASILRNAGNPYPVSALSLAVVSAALRAPDDSLPTHVEQVRRERAQLTEFLQQLGHEVPESQANFVCVDFGNRADDVQQSLAAQRIRVRRFAHRPEIANSLRITLPGDPDQFTVLLEGLRTSLDPDVQHIEEPL